jgi:hypothetical protein
LPKKIFSSANAIALGPSPSFEYSGNRSVRFSPLIVPLPSQMDGDARERVEVAVDRHRSEQDLHGRA